MVNSDNIKKRIKQVVKSADDSAMIILYGSRARGNAREGSDWDVLILSKKSTVSIKDEQLFRHKLYDLELQIGEPISTLVYSFQDWNNKLSVTPLHQNIQREGKIL